MEDLSRVKNIAVENRPWESVEKWKLLLRTQAVHRYGPYNPEKDVELLYIFHKAGIRIYKLQVNLKPDFLCQGISKSRMPSASMSNREISVFEAEVEFTTCEYFN